MTPAMQKCLAFISGYIAEHDGTSPSYQEIADALDYKSKSAVVRVVTLLLEEGKLVKLRGAHKARTLAVPERVCCSCGARLP